MPWHLPRDLKRFRKYTWDKPVIMGPEHLPLARRAPRPADSKSPGPDPQVGA